MAAAWEISIVSEKPISVELLNLIIKEYEVTDSHNQSIPDILFHIQAIKKNYHHKMQSFLIAMERVINV